MSVTGKEIAKEINFCEGTFPQYQENPMGRAACTTGKE